MHPGNRQGLWDWKGGVFATDLHLPQILKFQLHLYGGTKGQVLAPKDSLAPQCGDFMHLNLLCKGCKGRLETLSLGVPLKG